MTIPCISLKRPFMSGLKADRVEAGLAVDLCVVILRCAVHRLCSAWSKAGKMPFCHEPWLEAEAGCRGRFHRDKRQTAGDVCQVTMTRIPWMVAGRKPWVTNVLCGKIRKKEHYVQGKQSHIFFYWAFGPLNTHSSLSSQQPCETGWWPHFIDGLVEIQKRWNW